MSYFYNSERFFVDEQKGPKSNEKTYEGCIFWDKTKEETRRAEIEREFYIAFLTPDLKIDVLRLNNQLIFETDVKEVVSGQYVEVRVFNSTHRLRIIVDATPWGVLTKVRGCYVPDQVRQAFRKGLIRTTLGVKFQHLGFHSAPKLGQSVKMTRSQKPLRQSPSSLSMESVLDEDWLQKVISSSAPSPKIVLSQPEQELEALINEIRPLNFTYSSELSDYIVRKQLGHKYSSLIGDGSFQDGDNEWVYKGAIDSKYYAAICRRLGLKNKGSCARMVRFTPYKDM